MISSRLKTLTLALLLLCAGSLWTIPAVSQVEKAPVDPAPTQTSGDTAQHSDGPDANDEPADDAPETSPEPVDEEAYLQALADLALQQERIARLEESSAQNAYNAEITEAYLALGTTLRELERYEDSVAALDKALQAARISNGLNSVQQIPILEEMRLSYEANADWEGVDTNTHLIHYITTKNYPPGDERRIESLQGLGQWQLRAAREELFPGFRDSAGEAYTLYKNEIRRFENVDSYADRHLHLATLYLGQAAAAHSMAEITYERPLRDYQTGTQRTIQQRQCFPVRLADGRIVTVCQMVEVPDMDYYIDPSNRKSTEIARYLREVKDSILRAYQVLQNPTNNPERRDALLAELQRLTEQYNRFVGNP